MTSFKPGLGMLVAETSVPVVPCYLRGAFEAYPAHRKFPRLARIQLHIGEPLTFADCPNDRTGWNQIARQTEIAVRHLGNVLNEE
jgi:1-acyl-sn-glycerol-3-phosphate acyltransferase